MNIKETSIYKALKRNQIVFFTKYKLTDKDYLGAKEKMRSSTLKSKSQIREEMDKCREYWGCDAAHYVRYGLFDKNLSEEELLNYVPPYFFYNIYMPGRYGKIDLETYGNKLYEYKLFKEKDIPTPDIVAVVKKGKIVSVEGEPMSLDGLCDKMDASNLYFFKPVDGQGGTGIEVLNFANGGGKRLTLNDFINDLQGSVTYLVQERISQRADFMAVNESSVNTLRIVTQDVNGTPKVSCCVMRMGRNGSYVDNSHQGGLSCRVSVEDGSFFPQATAEHGGGLFDRHPDSGFKFAGSKVEGWNEIKNAVASYAQKISELKEIGWDIAVTDKGITVIEINMNYGIDHLQNTCGGMRRILNIYP